MEANFPASTPWDLSDIGDITDWVPSLLRLPTSRELTLLIYDLREIGQLMNRIDSARDPDALGEDEEDDGDHEVTPVAVPVKRPVPSLPTPRPIRSARSRKAAEIEEESVPDDEPIEPPSTQALSEIRVRRVTRTKKTSEDIEVVSDSVFPHKVRRSLVLYFALRLISSF